MSYDIIWHMQTYVSHTVIWHQVISYDVIWHIYMTSVGFTKGQGVLEVCWKMQHRNIKCHHVTSYDIIWCRMTSYDGLDGFVCIMCEMQWNVASYDIIWHQMISYDEFCSDILTILSLNTKYLENPFFLLLSCPMHHMTSYGVIWCHMMHNHRQMLIWGHQCQGALLCWSFLLLPVIWCHMTSYDNIWHHMMSYAVIFSLLWA